jgi:histidine decarboxylase
VPAQLPYQRALGDVERRMIVAHNDHLGYPYNLSFDAGELQRFSGFLVNNLGDPYVGSHYASEVCDLERQAIGWFQRLWQCDDEAMYWGSVGASGTEGNLWALYLGREALPGAVLVHSDEAHYSLPKAGRILQLDARSVRCDPSGAISLDHLAEVLTDVGDRPVILALTCGTTMKGAHDDIIGATDALVAAGIGPERRYVHIDGALNAMVVPFVAGAPANIVPSFRLPIDSISTSGHKMIGTPMPCGVLVARQHHVQRVASAVSYLRSNDTTLMGSRNGHAVLAIWHRVTQHGEDGFRADVASCMRRADRLVAELERADVPVLRDPYGLTVVFPEPASAIVSRFQLACDQRWAHAIVMPNVGDDLIDRFLESYLAWWREWGSLRWSS